MGNLKKIVLEIPKGKETRDKADIKNVNQNIHRSLGNEFAGR